MPPTDHFHVHIVNANHLGLMGMSVGQAYMLDDIISLVRSFTWGFRLSFTPSIVDSWNLMSPQYPPFSSG